MKIPFIFLSCVCYFFNNHPLKAMLQIDPTTGVVIGSDGTPADPHSIENVLGFTSGYKVDPKTSAVTKADGTPIDPQGVQDLIDSNVIDVVKNSVAKLNLTYDPTTGNVYDSEGLQVVSPQLDIVDKAIENSLNALLQYTPDTVDKDKTGNLLMKGVEWGTVSVVGVFLAYYGAKNLRLLYSENWRDLRKSAAKKALAKMKDMVVHSQESSQALAKAQEELKNAREKNKLIKEHEKKIDALKADNTKHLLKEKFYSATEKVASLIGATETAKKAKTEVEKAKLNQEKNNEFIKNRTLEKEMHQRGYNVERLSQGQIKLTPEKPIPEMHQRFHRTQHMSEHFT